MAAISDTVQPASAIRVTHVSSGVMEGQTLDASLYRFAMEPQAKAVRFPRSPSARGVADGSILSRLTTGLMTLAPVLD